MSTAELAPYDPATGEVIAAPPTASPAERIDHAGAVGEAVKDAIKRLNLSTVIQGRDYILAEGWQLIVSALGGSCEVDDVRPLDDGQGWLARAVVRDSDGRVLGRGQALCHRTEGRWKSADEYAVMSMAQTRAVGKAARLALGHIAKSAGYEATPAEEMPTDTAAAPQVPAWALKADRDQLRDSTIAALDALSIEGADHSRFAKALLGDVKAAAGTHVPAITVAVLRALVSVQDAYIAELDGARDAAAAADRDEDPADAEVVDPASVEQPTETPAAQSLPGVSEPPYPDAPSNPYDVGA